MDENLKRVLTARVLHSQLMQLDPPGAVKDAFTNWMRELEAEVRNNKSVAFSEEVSVSDTAQVDLVNVRGPKQ